MAKDKGKTNVAKSGFTAVQVGRVVPPVEGEDAVPAAPKKPAKGSTTNVQSGNARVGVVANTIVGDLNIRMSR